MVHSDTRLLREICSLINSVTTTKPNMEAPGSSFSSNQRIEHAGTDSETVGRASINGGWLPHVQNYVDDSASITEQISHVERPVIVSAPKLEEKYLVISVPSKEQRRLRYLDVGHGVNDFTDSMIMQRVKAIYHFDRPIWHRLRNLRGVSNISRAKVSSMILNIRFMNNKRQFNVVRMKEPQIPASTTWAWPTEEKRQEWEFGEDPDQCLTDLMALHWKVANSGKSVERIRRQPRKHWIPKVTIHWRDRDEIFINTIPNSSLAIRWLPVVESLEITFPEHTCPYICKKMYIT